MGNPYVAAGVAIGSAVIQAKQQKALGKYNQQVSERNAQIAEQEANQIGQQAEFDIARFDQKFRQADMGAAKKIEEAQFSRIQGQIARREARIANIQTAAKAGSSLLQIYAPNSIYNKPTGTV
jgi:hypothetical protein